MFNHTVNEDGGMTAETRSRDLSAIFAALADPTRRLISERLSRGEATPGELTRPLRISLPAVTKHLRVQLEELEVAASQALRSLSLSDHLR